MATQDEARSFALGLPETTSGEHRGREDLRVRNKIFATLPDDGSVVLKTRPDDFDALVRMDAETFRRVWGERWVGVDLSRIDAAFMGELMIDAWRLAAPKALVRAFEEPSRE